MLSSARVAVVVYCVAGSCVFGTSILLYTVSASSALSSESAACLIQSLSVDKISSDSDTSCSSENILRRRRDVTNYSPYKKKIAQVKGRPFTTSTGKQIPARKTGPACS